MVYNGIAPGKNFDWYFHCPGFHLFNSITFFEFYFIFIEQVLNTYLFYTYQCIHDNPNLPIHPTTHAPLSPCSIHMSVLHICISTSACKPVHLYHFSRFHIYALIYDICFSLSDLLHSVWQTLCPYTSLQMTQFHSFLWLSYIPLYICTTSSLSIHLLMGI